MKRFTSKGLKSLACVCERWFWYFILLFACCALPWRKFVWVICALDDFFYSHANKKMERKKNWCTFLWMRQLKGQIRSIISFCVGFLFQFALLWFSVCHIGVCVLFDVHVVSSSFIETSSDWVPCEVSKWFCFCFLRFLRF